MKRFTFAASELQSGRYQNLPTVPERYQLDPRVSPLPKDLEAQGFDLKGDIRIRAEGNTVLVIQIEEDDR